MPRPTLFSVAHPWYCDTMGHMNVRHYAAMFDDASFHLLGFVAAPGNPRLGWADVRYEIDYRHETPAGTLIAVETAVTRVGRASLTYRHVMTDRTSGRLHAEALVTTVRLDLDARKSMALAPDELERARSLLAE